MTQIIDNIGDGDNSKYKNSSVENEAVQFRSVSSGDGNGFWSKNRGDLSYNQLHKFWCELTPQDRQKLLKIDKQTLFEHARKNMYCSRCNGLLLEGFLQIVMYTKSMQQNAACVHYSVKSTHNQNDGDFCIGCQDDFQDPSVHPWGGLTSAKDGTLTVLDCYLYSKSLKGLQIVFDSARARERERELLYPDACGGGGRGWISQGIVAYGRGHGTRETCALHTARLSVETLVDFWSALVEETRLSLLRMKEEDFIERLMYRFDSKRFCRDCRRNVIREFKELKELKRMRREARCTNWFCAADTTFQYEVSRDRVVADWTQTFSDAFKTYHHFEWAIGTGEGKTDIREFHNVGLTTSVEANGLYLSDLTSCYITLRAWKKDGRCSEMCVKAHAVRGQTCVHSRLVVGEGFVMITRGESMRGFFEHAEEAEEEEDDDAMDKDGNEVDGECSRPQKHAKSPELAREFLLDAATVIFKEQVEKAFREGTARQNAHSIFVCLALQLLEERVHVACKEIITLEKQKKLLEEEEREKQEEEERKERKKTKEREKKLRRKERLREKENKENKCDGSDQKPAVSEFSKDDLTPSVEEDTKLVNDMVSETGEANIEDDQILTEEKEAEDCPAGEVDNIRDSGTSFPYEDRFNYSQRRSEKDPQQNLSTKWSDRRRYDESRYHHHHVDGFESSRTSSNFNKQARTNANIRNGGLKLSGKNQCPNNESHTCNHHSNNRSRADTHRHHKLETRSDMSKQFQRGNKYTQVESNRSKNIPQPTKQVWEPLDAQKKKVAQSNSETIIVEASQLPEEETNNTSSVQISHEHNNDGDVRDSKSPSTESEFRAVSNSLQHSKDSPNTSSSSSSCLSEGDSSSSSTSSSKPENTDSTASDSEEAREKESSCCRTEQMDITSSAPEEAPSCCDNGRETISVGAQSPSVVNQTMHYPLYQNPSMVHYHPTPVSWPAVPVPYYNNNHYLYPNTFGYGVNGGGNARLMQYSGVQQHMMPPFLNPSHTPMFQRTSQVNGVGGLKQVQRCEDSMNKVAPTPSAKDVANNGFSLFHFGGPVALYEPGLLKQGAPGNTCPNVSEIRPDKKDSVGEYNLFAATDGIKFSFS